MPISNIIIKQMLNQIRKVTEHDEDDIDMMRFSMEAVLWEIEKLSYLLLIFLALGFHLQFFAAMLAVITIRPGAGGFHASNPIGCLLWTLFGFALAIFALPLIPLNNVIIIAAGIFSIAATFVAAPIRSMQMERIADKSKDKHKKYITTVITLGWFVLIFLNQDFFLTEAVMWVIFLLNVQLLIEYGRRRKPAKEDAQ